MSLQQLYKTPKEAMITGFFLADAGMYEEEANPSRMKSIFVEMSFARGTLRQLLCGKEEHDDDFFKNLFFMPNSGPAYIPPPDEKTGKKKPRQEDRHKESIDRFRFLYVDADLKDEEGNHYKGEELETRVADMREKLKQHGKDLVDYIVRSKNGCHIYLRLPENEVTSLEQWQALENQYAEAISLMGVPGVDAAACTANRILRVPGSLHMKKDSTEPFRIHLVYARHADEITPKAYRRFRPGMYAQPLETTLKAIEKIHAKPVEKLPEFEELHRRLYKEKASAKAEAGKTRAKGDEQKSVESKGHRYYRQAVSKAIAERNPDDSIFDALRKEYKRRKPIIIPKAIKLIKQAGFQSLVSPSIRKNKLKNGKYQRESTNSLLYFDASPSDYYYYSQSEHVERWVYYCLKERHTYNHLLDLVTAIWYEPEDQFDKLSYEKKEAVQSFTFQIFGLQIVSNNEDSENSDAPGKFCKLSDEQKWTWNEEQYQLCREGNIETLKAVSELLKEKHPKTRWMTSIITAYEIIMDLWKEHVEQTHAPWQKCHRSIGCEFFAKKLKERKGKDTAINRSDINVANITLSILTYLGCITRVNPQAGFNDNLARGETAWVHISKRDVWRPVNEYCFPDIRQDESAIFQKALLIDKNIQKPLKNFSLTRIADIENREN